ncbi:thioredoxin domain-containing protein [Holospora undulata]|uniref:Thioredoxin-like fold domain-containing protein n=1 Tax=Holospora undulata HU1 TaxID=1321371 RepID=A0A061JHI4_9PROT|nr:DsbA family protein [Holospora undulata]ETZ04882.1 hypothetical protein K737_300707 [Holospora undulata HU1]
MKKIFFCFLFGMCAVKGFAKVSPEEIVEMFEQNPEMFNVLAQMSYHYGAGKNQGVDSEEEILKKSLQNIELDSIPSIPLTETENTSKVENSVIAFVSPYCPHCRSLIKNLIQLEKEKFFGNHTDVRIVYAPTNSASHCAIKALMAAHKIKKNDGLEKTLGIIDTRFNPVEALDWPKLFAQHHPEISEKSFSEIMNCPEVEHHSKKCAQYISKLNMESFPVIALCKKSSKKHKKELKDIILGNPSHIGLLSQALRVKLSIK